MNLSRRNFVKSTALSTVTYFLPESPVAKGGSPESPNDQIRIAAIGVGNQGKGNLAIHAKNCVAVCEVDSSRLGAAVKQVEKACGKLPVAEKEYRKILDRKDIDAVIITTPDHWHAMMAVDACNAGKDVYCEKTADINDRGRAKNC